MKRLLPPLAITGVTAGALATLSFLKSLHCRANFFASPDSYTHLCYSDIPALFGARGLDQGINPYSDPLNSMEYPVGTGYIASTIARFSDDFLTFFDLNAMAIALLFIATTILIASQTPRLWPLFALAPASLSSLYINWDIWGVFTMVLGIYYLKRERFDLAGIWMGISIVIKLFPIFFIPAFAIYFFLRSRSSREEGKNDGKGGTFFLYLLFTVVALNFTTAISHFDGWSRFFTFNQDRGVDLGSIWYALSLLFGVNVSSLNLTIALLGLLLLVAIYPRLRAVVSTKQDPYEIFLLATFLSLALLFSVNKVYSPQYIIWLTPLAVLLMATRDSSYRTERAWFWIWQIGEAIYHLGIWQYLAEYSGGQGLSEPLYALTIVIRIITLAGFALTVARARLSLPSKEPVKD